MKTAALYARVSTADGRQTVENQLLEMRRFAEKRGWALGQEYLNIVSGGARRDELDGLMEDARRGKFDVLVVWALDRLTREGVLAAFEYVHKLSEAGVLFCSVTEPQFNTDGNAGELFLAIAAWMAQQERQRLGERVRAGLQRARAEGIRLGRPRVHVDTERMKMLYVGGKSLRQIGDEMNLSRSTVERASREWRQKRRQEVGA